MSAYCHKSVPDMIWPYLFLRRMKHTRGHKENELPGNSWIWHQFVPGTWSYRSQQADWARNKCCGLWHCILSDIRLIFTHILSIWGSMSVIKIATANCVKLTNLWGNHQTHATARLHQVGLSCCHIGHSWLTDYFLLNVLSVSQLALNFGKAGIIAR